MRHIITIIAVLLACPAFAGSVSYDKRPKGGVEVHEAPKRQQGDRLTMAQAEKMPEHFDRLLAAIEKVETGAEKDPAKAVGYHGKAHGWMQIHEDYYIDAATQVVSSPTDPMN